MLAAFRAIGLLAAVSYVLFPGAAVAQEEDAPAEAGRLTRAPVLVEFVEADYPEEAAAEGLEGTVGLSLVIDETGRVTEVEVTEPAGHGFDEAAVAAARRFRFEPAEVDGEPAPVQVAYRYGFVLEEAPEVPAAAEEAPVNFTGRVLERGTRTPLADASVRIAGAAAATDAEGRFELRGVPAGTWPVRVLHPGHRTFETEETVAEGEVVVATYYLLARAFDPYETVVRADRPKKEVVRRTLTLEEVQRIPGTRGDALRVVQTLPGVARTPYGLGPLVIRGAGPFDSRTFLDGHWIPLPFHFGGLTSIFNGDLVESIALYPGSYSARFGRAIGGILRVDTRAGRDDGLHGYADVDLYDAGFLLEGPLGEAGADTTFAVAARRSYVDAVLGVALSDSSFRITPFYWDYQAKLDHDLGGGESLSLTAYGSHDQLVVATSDPELVSTDVRESLRTTIDFHRITGEWRQRPSRALTAEHSLTFGWDGTGNSFGSDLFFDATYWLSSLRSDWSLAAARDLTLDWGLDALLWFWSLDAQGPAVPAPGEVVNPDLGADQVSTTADGVLLYPALWADATWQANDWLRLVAGLRLDLDAGLTDLDVYPGPSAYPQPRLTALARVAEATVLKAGAGLYRQPPQPFALVPAFGNPNLTWESAVHTGVGVEHRLFPWLSVDLELFYEPRNNLAVRSDVFVTRDGEVVRENYRSAGTGRAVGLELYLKIVEVRGLVAWLSYTLSRAWVEQALGEPETVFPFDQTHNLVAVASWELGAGWAVGGTVRWVTGIPTNPLLGTVYDADADAYVPIFGDASNEARLRPFFSLDLRVDRRWTFPTWMLDLYLEVTNATNYDNIEGELWNFDYTEKDPLPGLPIFPSLGIKAAF